MARRVLASETGQLDRREFFGLAARSAAALAALPAAASWLAGCGSSEESPAPAASSTPPRPAAPEPTPPAPRPQAPAPPSPPSPATSGAAGDAQLAVEIAAMQPVLDALQYVDESEKPDQRCDNCLFYSAEGNGLGKCELIPQGLIKQGGWCASWAEKTA